MGRKLKVAQALDRMVVQGKLREAGRNPSAWSLAS
jgi:hypothetical protein